MAPHIYVWYRLPSRRYNHVDAHSDTDLRVVCKAKGNSHWHSVRWNWLRGCHIPNYYADAPR